MNNEQLMEVMSKKVDEIHRDIVGQPGERHKGLVVRVDRLEQSRQDDVRRHRRMRNWTFGAVFVAAGAVLESFMGRFIGGGN